MNAMPSPKYLRETATKALIHSGRPGSRTVSVFLVGLEFKNVVTLSCLFLMETFEKLIWEGLFVTGSSFLFLHTTFWPVDSSGQSLSSLLFHCFRGFGPAALFYSCI